MSGRTCGTCRWCERWDEERGIAYDPWSELDEPLRTTMREKAGICDDQDNDPCAVMLDSPCELCEGDGYERRNA